MAGAGDWIRFILIRRSCGRAQRTGLGGGLWRALFSWQMQRIIFSELGKVSHESFTLASGTCIWTMHFCCETHWQGCVMAILT